MSTLNAVIVAVALLAAACSAKAAGPPEIVVDTTACSHCGMLISEPVYAAAFRAHGQEPRVFDEIGCMLEAIRRETTMPTDIWVQDAAGGGWLDANEAIFVGSSRIRTPMNGGLLAYAHAAAAAKAAAAYGGEEWSFAELTTRKGDVR